MELGEYEKIVILSTLAEPRTLHDIGKAWYGHKTRLYHKTARKKLDEAVKRGTLIREGKLVYRANTPKIIGALLKEIGLGEEHNVLKEYRDRLRFFYLNLGEYTQKVYLGFEVIKALTQEENSGTKKRLSVHKGTDLDLGLLLQLPFLLRYIERKNPLIANVLIQALKLEAYEQVIDAVEFHHRPILRKHKWEEDWIDCFRKMDQLLPKLEKKGVAILAKGLKAMKTSLGGR